MHKRSRAFVFHVQPKFIGVIQRGGMRREDGGTEGIEISRFHQLDIEPVDFISQSAAEQRIGLQSRNALELDRLSVKQASLALDLNGPKTNLRLYARRRLAGGRKSSQQFVKSRLLRVPGFWRGNLCR